ncbi:hypothetical protein TDB9533_03194 [Thalassocella blandensis]|nr:hypothetical protein TDB9533_03194 [Thalassocella blandensis]
MRKIMILPLALSFATLAGCMSPVEEDEESVIGASGAKVSACNHLQHTCGMGYSRDGSNSYKQYREYMDDNGRIRCDCR